MKLPFRAEFLQPFVVHGGAIYSLADAAAAHALMTKLLPVETLTTVEQRTKTCTAKRKSCISAGRWPTPMPASRLPMVHSPPKAQRR